MKQNIQYGTSTVPLMMKKISVLDMTCNAEGSTYKVLIKIIYDHTMKTH